MTEIVRDANLLQVCASEYMATGLCVLPAKRLEKRPAVGSWKRYQKRLPSQAELSAWMARQPDGICILCGSVSGNAEMIDFDAGGDRFEAWWDRIPLELRERLVVETTPAGGMHVTYRCHVPISGNLKLAQRKVGDQIKTLIETRGEGGLFLCAPTQGYMLAHGDYANLPVLTETERDLLLQTAWDLNEYVPPVINGPNCASHSGDIGPMSESAAAPGELALHSSHTVHGSPESADRPGDDYNHRGDVRRLLEQHGWALAKPGENEYWRRPGKNHGWSATLKHRVFYVFSANAAPFEPNRAYSPFAVYTMLEHDGDWAYSASTLSQLGHGGTFACSLADGVDISAMVKMPAAQADCASHNRESGHLVTLCGEQTAQVSVTLAPEDPGPLPIEMLRVPGFVSEVMDHTLTIAPYPNPVMAFAGALALQAVLAGRKVRDPGDNRTNIYLLGLAHSSAGKDQSRKVNTDVLHAVGMADCLGLHFASGEGLQDALFQTPAMLFQTDEIDGMLESINKAKDARHEAIMGTMLTMYSSANSVYPMRRKASTSTPGGPAKPPGVIDQPCLVLYGTAIPNRYYQALSERMLTNGFFARMIILESGPRPEGQEPRIGDLPPRVLATARWWADYRPGTGNLQDWHPTPTVVEHSDGARCLLIETRRQAEIEYTAAESRSDPVGTTVWGRVSEQIRKLALLYAISEDHRSPHIGLAAVQWASRFVMHQTRRMLFMAAGHVAENPFHAECLKAIEKLRSAAGHVLTHSVLLKRMKLDAKAFTVLIETLIQQGDIEVVTVSTPGRSMRAYRLAEAVKEAGETSTGGER
jgi:hypothetical protein